MPRCSVCGKEYPTDASKLSELAKKKVIVIARDRTKNQRKCAIINEVMCYSCFKKDRVTKQKFVLPLNQLSTAWVAS